MAKPVDRPHGRYALEAVTLLGNLIRKARIERKETAAELAERAGVSRGLVQRVERGDPGCSIGAAFEMGALVGVRLFDLDKQTLAANNQAMAQMLTLLPSAARAPRKAVKDDF